MNKMKYIIMFASALLFWACSSEEDSCTEPLLTDSAVRFVASLGGAEEKMSEGKTIIEYENNYFVTGDQIRIYCPVSYSSVSFSDGSDGLHIYRYDKFKDGSEGSDWSDWPYMFIPEENTLGFDWRTMQPTSIYYIFEALHFPGQKYYDRVPSDQSTESEYENADMLIAHHRSTFDKKGQVVPLTFYHAFSMVEVTVTLPVSETAAEGVYPPDALEGVYMKQMLTKYEVNYSEVITSDGLRTVKGVEKKSEVSEKTDDEQEVSERSDIKMFCHSKKDITKDNVKYQEYVYRGIVPEQEFSTDGNDFLYFYVRRNDGSGKPSLYRFKVTGDSFSLVQSEILSLKVMIDDNTNDVVVLTAEVKPWKNAETDFTIEQDK